MESFKFVFIFFFFGQQERKTPRDCLHDPSIPNACVKLRMAFFECRRSMVSIFSFLFLTCKADLLTSPLSVLSQRREIQNTTKGRSAGRSIKIVSFVKAYIDQII